MHLARVIGSIWATVKHPPLEGGRFVMLQPVDTDLTPFGDPLAALDTTGSGPGEIVLYTTSGEAPIPWRERHPALELAAVDATVVAVVDRVDDVAGDAS